MTTTVLLALFIAIVGKFLAEEVRAWFGWIHKKMRSKAVSRLPEGSRDRYSEEWESGLDEVPGEILKLRYSLGLLGAANGIRKATLESDIRSRSSYEFLKRLFDIAFSGMSLITIAPLLFAIAIAIKLSSDGPVFYSSERIGKNGRIFRYAKFRTMVLDAVERNGKNPQMDERDDVLINVAYFPRITRLGSFLRKYSLDELPQFINVLRGDMSIVGPRPPIATDVRDYKASHMRRTNVTAGITGLWQVKGRQDPSFESPVSIDEAYAKNRGFWLDLKIIARTILLVFSGTDSGADHDKQSPDDNGD